MIKYLGLTDGNGHKVLVPISNYRPPIFETIAEEDTRYGHLTKDPFNCATKVIIPQADGDNFIVKVRQTTAEIAGLLNDLLTTFK